MIKVNKKVGKIIENVIYVLILLPLVIASVRIVFQKILYPEMIPDIFGYKMFVILDENMDESLKYGDLVITYNQNKDKIEGNNLIAYRNDTNLVTITSKNVKMDKYEGLVVNIIPKLGSLLYFISQPIAMVIISCIILAIGGVWIYIAGKIDNKETIELELEKTQKNETDKEEKTDRQKKDKKDSILI